MKNVLFMDIIDVVHTQKIWVKGPNGKSILKDSQHPKIENKFNNEQAVQWIAQFCEQYDFQIVITSMMHMIFEWKQTFRTKMEDALGIDRNLAEWQKIFKNSGMRNNVKIIGRLNPDDMFSCTDREETITNFVNRNHIDNFIIVSNQPVYSERLKMRTISCPKSGFLGPQFQEAEEMVKGA